MSRRALRPAPPEHWSLRKQLAHYEGRLTIRLSPRTQMTAAACVAIFTLLSLLMLAGCYSDEIHLRVCDAGSTQNRCSGLDHITRESNDALYDAQDILGFPLLLTDNPNGAVTVILIDGYDEAIWGRSINIDAPCRRVVHSVRRGDVIAHEIGHALGLDHVKCGTWRECKAAGAQDRVMLEYNGGMSEFADFEIDRMRYHMRLLELCRGD